MWLGDWAVSSAACLGTHEGNAGAACLCIPAHGVESAHHVDKKRNMLEIKVSLTAFP
jgi:hypothetical protein